jgi:hypothetical protein
MTGTTDSGVWRPGFSSAVMVAALSLSSAAAAPPFDTKAVDAVFAD